MSEQTPTPTESNITTALRDHAVPIDIPVLHPDNPRRGNVEAIAESLQRFGQLRPIVVQSSTAYVVAGNHTLRAARELGWQEIAAVGIDLDDDEAKAYVVADNRLSDIATNDDAALAHILESLMLVGKLGGTGWSPDQVDDLMSAMEVLPEITPEPTEATHGATDEEIAQRYKDRATGGALRQFVFLYPQDVGVKIEVMLTRLARAWGVSGARDVVLEALSRASAEPPVEGLTPEEAARANAPMPEEDTSDAVTAADVPPDPETIEALGHDKTPPPAERQQTPLERAGLVNPPSESTPPQPATLREQEEQRQGEDRERTNPEQLMDPPSQYPR